MVGGEVVGVAINKATGVCHVSCVDTRNHPNDSPTSVRVRGKHYDEIRPGDALWWQMNKAYWTPQENLGKPHNTLRQGVDFDIPLEKVGYSHH